jgi:hypothetical protein
MSGVERVGRVLKDDLDAPSLIHGPALRAAGQPLTAQSDFAARQRMQAGDDASDRGLPGAGFADECDARSATDPEADSAGRHNGLAAATVFGNELADLEYGL